LVDREVFDRRLARLEELLSHLRRLARTDKATYQADPGLKAQSERWLQLVAECCLDLANHLIAEQGWTTPRTYREAFEILAEHDVLDDIQAGEMARWAGLRNVLVHLYLAVDHEILFEIMTKDLDQVERFARALSKALGD
jgi:uncharacterized protein YutE (UPF0331/DUF86 family)